MKRHLEYRGLGACQIYRRYSIDSSLRWLVFIAGLIFDLFTFVLAKLRESIFIHVRQLFI